MSEKSKKVLLAEDEKPLALAMQLKLKKEGINADIVSNGEELLAKYDSGHYDLIVTDLVMPKVDGFKVLEGLKERNSTIPVIVTSNLSQEEDREKALAMGAKEYLVKSNTHIVVIIEHIQKALK